MKHLWTLACAIAVLGAGPAQAVTSTSALTPMPEPLEIRFAASALPPALRDKATVYVLDPATGYRIARQGSNGIACLVERTQWELADFRDDIFIPLCYDQAGLGSYVQSMLDTAALRASGKTPAAVKEAVDKRYHDGTYVLPTRAGLSYMLAPVMRTIGPPDLQVHTMAMPHLMFYAPGVTNADIGAKPDLADPATLAHPFIDRQGPAEQSYIIQMTGEAEKARILADEHELVADLCTWRAVLCLDHAAH